MKIVVSVVFLLLTVAAAFAEKVALVIGNSSYKFVESLENPVNDAQAVEDALLFQGFSVTRADNLTYAEMRRSLRKFRKLADNSEYALVYYAGHGIEIAGINYFIPVDAMLEDERDASVELIDVSTALYQISGARRMKMLVLDSCRNNPFARKMKRGNLGRNVGRGLAEAKPEGSDTLIAYAAAAGEITLDGPRGENSPFTKAFVAALSAPPADVRKLLGIVRDEMRKTAPDAAPYVYNSLGGSDYIINPNSQISIHEAAVPSLTEQVENEDGFYADYAKSDVTGTINAWLGFLTKHEGYRSHPLYSMALKKLSSLGTPPPPEPTVKSLAPRQAEAPANRNSSTPSVSEEEHHSASKQDTRVSAALPETDSISLAKDVTTSAQPPLVAVQLPKLPSPALGPPDDPPIPASARSDPTHKPDRISTLAIASLEPEEDGAVEVGREPNFEESALQLQEELKKRRCYLGSIDGVLGRNSRAAVSQFSRASGVALKLPTKPNLTDLKPILYALNTNDGVLCNLEMPEARNTTSQKPAKPLPGKRRDCISFQGQLICN